MMYDRAASAATGTTDISQLGMPMSMLARVSSGSINYERLCATYLFSNTVIALCIVEK